jgi:hypothetical protein
MAPDPAGGGQIRAVLMPGERAASEPVGPERAEIFIYLFPGDELRD